MSVEYLDKTHARLWYTEGSGSDRIRKSKRIEYHGKKDAERQDREYQLEMQDAPSIGCSMTVEGLVNWYIDSVESAGLKPTTITGYRSVSKRIFSAFRGTKADELKMYQVEQFILAEAKIISPKTIKNEISILNSAYIKAIRAGVLKDNPCVYANIPKQRKAEKRIIKDDELPLFLEALEKENLTFRVAIKLALFCGMRLSEILGLKAENVNLTFRTIGIHQTRHRLHGQDSIQDTKTKSSDRMVSIPQLLEYDLLEILKIRDEWIICNDFGEPLSASSLEKKYRRFTKRIGIDVSIHGLRHTHASMLHSAGIDLAEISAQLGHSNISTTLSIYTHVFSDATVSSRRIADTIDKMSPKCHQAEIKKADTV